MKVYRCHSLKQDGVRERLILIQEWNISRAELLWSLAEWMHYLHKKGVPQPVRSLELPFLINSSSSDFNRIIWQGPYDTDYGITHSAQQQVQP